MTEEQQRIKEVWDMIHKGIDPDIIPEPTTVAIRMFNAGKLYSENKLLNILRDLYVEILLEKTFDYKNSPACRDAEKVLIEAEILGK